MAENLIRSKDEVWVHSNLYDFHSTLKPVLQDTSIGDLDAYIEQLDAYIGPLKQRADEFIRATNSGDYLGLSKKLFGVGEADVTFSGCAKRTLADVRFIRALQALEYDFKALLAEEGQMNKRLKRELLKQIDLDITEKIKHGSLVKNIEDILVRLLIKNKKINTASEQSAILKSLGYEGQVPKRLLTSAKGEVRDYAKNFAEQVLAKSNQSLGEQISNAYEKIFRINWENGGFVTTLNKSALDIEINKLSDEVGKKLSKEILASLANILGSTGEAGLSVVHEVIGSQIEITVTGDKSEEEVAKLMSKIVMGSEDEYKKYFLKSTHHDLTKQSQTDLILTANGVSVKAQAKNSIMEAMKEKLEENGYDYDHMMPYIREMDKQQNLTKLLDILTSDKNEHYALLTEQDASAIAYLLANASWFRYAGSASEKHSKDVKISEAQGGIAGIYRVAENLLSVAIKDLIGMEIVEDGFHVDASNIFYLIGNRVAFPVYLMLEEYKNQLKGVRQELFSLRYITSPLSGIQPSNADQYRQKILDSLDGISPSRERIGQDTDVGFEMGKNILAQLNGHINFNFNIAKQLGKISYKF